MSDDSSHPDHVQTVDFSQAVRFTLRCAVSLHGIEQFAHGRCILFETCGADSVTGSAKRC